ncbi:O-antigen polysaccharide polymerase Wzy, partial [Turicibacter sanguinis]|nr:O-antigen polysaccharide polymerase Wzy [Turicibacter sanguinis]
LLIYLKFEFNSISFIFITLSYIFHFGQLIVKNINRDHLLIFDVSTVVPLDIFIKSNIFSLFILSAVSVGCMCAKKTNYQLRKQTNNKKKISNKKIILLGIIILLTSFPLDIFFTIKKILVANQSGYLDVLGVESSGILSQFARFHLIGVALIIMGFSDRPKKSIFIFILYAIYSLVVMMTGSRIYPVVSLLILGLILLKSINKKLSIKVILILSIPAFLLITVLNIIADFRNIGIINMQTIISIFGEYLQDNPLFGVLEEFGATMYTVCLTIMKVPNEIDFSRGIQFLTSFASVFPNINGIFSEINYESNFVLHLKTQAIGGSYIAEIFYSFEYFTYLFAIGIGIFIQKVSDKLDIYLCQKDYINVGYLILPIFTLIIWIRGSYMFVLRNSIWAAIYLFILTMIVLKSKKNK